MEALWLIGVVQESNSKTLTHYPETHLSALFNSGAVLDSDGRLVAAAG